MAEVVAILSTSWRLIKAIDEVIDTIEQTREDAIALAVSSVFTLSLILARQVCDM
jgi:hypothetical protein